MNLKLFLVLLAVCALAGWSFRLRDYSIGGVRLGDHWSSVKRRFPSAQRAPNGLQMGGGESHISYGFARYQRCFELGPDFVVAFDQKGRVEAVEGSQLELNGQRILGPRDGSENAERYLGKFIDGTSSDADYLSYSDRIVLRLNTNDPTLYALYR